ncbi:MAG: M4 family metallopeptidase [Deltaproteobacteria bacterium]|nr:M4 family metallopeptidase [Deltaproteobacteria bacterium]
MLKRVLLFLVAFLLVAIETPALAQPPRIDVDKIRDRSIRALISSSPTAVSGLVDPSGKVISMEGRFVMAPAGSAPDVTVRRFLDRYSTNFSIPRNLRGYKVLSGKKINKDLSRVNVRQTYNGVAVFGSGLFVDVSGNGEVIAVCNNQVPVAPGVNVTPGLTNVQAASKMRSALNLREGAAPELTLGIVDRGRMLAGKSDPRLVWGAEIATPEGVTQAFIDARDGSLVFSVFTPVDVSSQSGSCASPTPQYHLNARTGAPDFMTFGPAGLWIPESSSNDPGRVALAFFQRYPTVFGTGDAPNQLRVASIERRPAPLSMTHVVLDQVYGGIPVYGAQLRVHLSPSMTISSISGNYVRDPQVLLTPVLTLDRAKFAAVSEVLNMRNGLEGAPEPPETERGRGRPRLDTSSALFRNRVTELNRQVRSKGLVIMPAVLSNVSGIKNELTYLFQFPEANIFVSAATGNIAFVIPNYMDANRLVYDARGGNELDLLHPPTLVFNNGNQVSTTAPNADAARADAFITRTLGAYATLGRTSYDDHDSAAVAVTNATLIFGGCPNAHWDAFRNQMWFCLGTFSGDVLAHEFTHGVTQTTAGLIYLDESGALNEHYSDVMASVAFPDAITPPAPQGWLIGEGTTFVRDMANQPVRNYANYAQRGPGCQGLIDVFDPANNCDMGNVHTNSGIGNRAAVLLADGLTGTPHTGIGRDRLGRLFLETLSTRMHPWAAYTDELHNTWETARDFEARGVRVTSSTSPSSPLLDFNGAANEVSWAFTQVGVDARLISGWYDIGGGVAGGRGDLVFFDGLTLPGGLTVADVELVVRAMAGGVPYWEGRSRVSTGGNVTFPGGVFGANITGHGIGTPNERTTVHYFHSGFLPLQISVNVISSNPATPLPERTEVETAARVHWVGVGDRGDDTINAGVNVTGAGCVVDDVVLELLDRQYQVVATTRQGDADAVQTYQAGLITLSYGARVSASNRGTANEEVSVHWWYDIGSANRYRLRYYLLGNNCSL